MTKQKQFELASNVRATAFEDCVRTMRHDLATGGTVTTALNRLETIARIVRQAEAADYSRFGGVPDEWYRTA